MHVHRSALRIPCFAIAAVLGFAAPAASQVTTEEAVCRAKFAKGFAKVLKATTKSIAGCHKLRNKGDVAAATDCNDPATADVQTGAKAAGAFSKWQGSVNDACASVPTILDGFSTCPAPYDDDDDAGATTDIDSYDEALSCLHVHAASAVAIAADTALGSPTPPLATDVSKCHGSIARGFAKTIDAVIKYRNQCQAAADKSGGTLGFDCFTTENDAKIALTVSKAGDSIEQSCVTDVALADSCGATAAAIEACAIEGAAVEAADAVSPLAWELRGVCPGFVTLALGASRHELGWTGLGHGEEPAGGYDLLEFPLTCNSNCTSCTGTPTIEGDHCRCLGDSSESCSTNSDCAGFGGECRCYWAPPTPVTAGGIPACIVPVVSSLSAGTAVPATGEAAVNALLALRYYIGNSYPHPCPACESGTCTEGARAGLACTVDAIDPVLGQTSLDCFPNQANNVSGTGLLSRLELTTGAFSMPFNLPCDSPYGSDDCACSTCSLNNGLACNDDSTCMLAGAGVCRTDGAHGGEPRRKNRCDDTMCYPFGSGEGVCGGGPADQYCDGLIRENGRGVIPCLINEDCDQVTCPDNPGGSCGACTHGEISRCFVDPIEATGAPGATLVGGGCTPPTGSSVVNDAYGWPGPFRLAQSFTLHSVRCADGTTPFHGPGGSNCP